MPDRPTFIERAFELAQTGQCASMKSVHQQMKAEGYSNAGQLSGGSLRKQLLKLIAASKVAR